MMETVMICCGNPSWFASLRPCRSLLMHLSHHLSRPILHPSMSGGRVGRYGWRTICEQWYLPARPGSVADEPSKAYGANVALPGLEAGLSRHVEPASPRSAAGSSRNCSRQVHAAPGEEVMSIRRLYGCEAGSEVLSSGDVATSRRATPGLRCIVAHIVGEVIANGSWQGHRRLEVTFILAADESMRGRVYLVAGVIYPASAERIVEQLARRHRLPGQRRFHAKAENDSRRRAFLKSCIQSGTLRVWVYLAPFPAAAAREVIIRAVVADAIDRRVARMILESADPGRDLRDRRVISQSLAKSDSDLVHEHRPPWSCAGLEVADAVAWAYGAGKSWRQLVAPMIDLERDLSP